MVVIFLLFKIVFCFLMYHPIVFHVKSNHIYKDDIVVVVDPHLHACFEVSFHTLK